MKLLLKSWLMLVLLSVLVLGQTGTPPDWIDGQTTTTGLYTFGYVSGSSFEGQYGESWVRSRWSNNNQDATHLNYWVEYSDFGSNSTLVDVWISKDPMMDNPDHEHGNWWCGESANFSNAHKAGTFNVADNNGFYMSSDISSWLSNGYAITDYFILFWLKNVPNGSLTVNQVWIGPPVSEWGYSGAIEPEPIIPEEHSLINYPNPFNPETTIKFYNNKLESVSIVIYNVAGQKVRTLVNEELMSIGEYELKWDGKNESGESLPSGTYFYKIITPTMTSGSKMTLIR
jgi:hypothetical protein